MRENNENPSSSNESRHVQTNSSNSASPANSAGPKANNPCGICRAFGLPVCKGHGGGGGSGDPSSEAKSSSSALTAAAPLSLTPKPAENLLTQSELWLHNNWSSSFDLKAPDALMSIKLEMEDCLITILGHDNLSEEQQKTLDEFYKVINNEFDEFKNGLAARGISVENMQLKRVGNDLTISIPNPKYYDAFVQQLIDKNFLATKQPNALQDTHEAAVSTQFTEQVRLEPAQDSKKSKIDLEQGSEPTRVDAQAPEQGKTLHDQEHESTAPTPFSMVLKPKGWDLES